MLPWGEYWLHIMLVVSVGIIPPLRAAREIHDNGLVHHVTPRRKGGHTASGGRIFSTGSTLILQFLNLTFKLAQLTALIPCSICLSHTHCLRTEEQNSGEG